MNSVLGVIDEKASFPSIAPAQNSFPAAKARSDSTFAISFENLRVIYPARLRGETPKIAVKGLNLSIVQGECFGFLGPNGAGKTTTMNVLLGFVQPTGGT